MSGDCVSYRLNEPMRWDEFKKMPCDVQEIYLKGLINRYNAPLTALAKMLGVHRTTLVTYIAGNLNVPHVSNGGNRLWGKEAFYSWCAGSEVPAPSEAPAPPDVQEENSSVASNVDDLHQPDPAATVQPSAGTIVPKSGRLDFEGGIDDILATLSTLFSGARGNATFSWEVTE